MGDVQFEWVATRFMTETKHSDPFIQAFYAALSKHKDGDN